MRYFLIDRVTELVVGERIRGIKAITLTDEVLHDHFPDYPVMPGMLMKPSHLTMPSPSWSTNGSLATMGYRSTSGTFSP